MRRRRCGPILSGNPTIAAGRKADRNAGDGLSLKIDVWRFAASFIGLAAAVKTGFEWRVTLNTSGRKREIFVGTSWPSPLIATLLPR